MYGRYGADKLGMAILLFGLVLSLVGSFANQAFLCLLAYIPMFYVLWRMFSRNTQKRYQENLKFVRQLDRIKDRKNRYFHCPRCMQTVRVPKGRGKISIKCPKCGEKFVKKT